MRKVKVALIDSGFDSLHDFCLKYIRAFYNVTQNSVCKADNLDDLNGHGTACAYIINNNIEDTYDLYVYKVFDQDLNTTISSIIKALEHCLVIRPDIINLSLGTINDNEELRQICSDLYRKNITIVAAASDDENLKIWPADYNMTVKVCPNKEKKQLYYDLNNKKVSIYSYSGSRRAAWLDGKYAIVHGNSFACAYVTGVLANYMNEKQLFGFSEIRKNINNLATRIRPSENKNNIKLFDCERVLLYPFNKEMHSLFRFRDLLPFSIDSIVDLPFLGTAKKDAGTILGLKQSGVIIETNFEKVLEKDIDTVVLGDLSALSNIYKKNITLKYAELSFKKNKNVISIELLDASIKEDINTLAKKNNCKFLSLNDFVIDGNIVEYDKGIKAPILLVLGTGPKVGKFTLQLTLKQCLEYIGYKVINISTEPHGFLFNMKVFPLGNWNLLQYISFEKHIDALKSLIITEAQRNQPDIMLIGGQSGVVPYSGKTSIDYNCLSSIIAIMATKADAILLCINPDDEVEYIKRTISAIESFGYGKIIMCFMSSLSRKIVTKKGIRIENKVIYSGKTLSDKLKYYEEKLNVPVLSIDRNEDIVKGIKLIQDSFS